jgi:hypothetical protein
LESAGGREGKTALGIRRRVKEVLSTALESRRQKPCRFVYEVDPG